MPNVVPVAKEADWTCDMLTVSHMRDIYAAFQPDNPESFRRRDLTASQVAKLVKRDSSTIRKWAKESPRHKDASRRPMKFSLSDVTALLAAKARPFRGDSHKRWVASELDLLFTNYSASRVANETGRSKRAIHIKRCRLRITKSAAPS